MDQQIDGEKKVCGENCDSNCCVSKKCGCAHHGMLPTLVILLALNFLLGTLNVYNNNVVQIIWPILVIVGAGSAMKKNKCKCC